MASAGQVLSHLLSSGLYRRLRDFTASAFPLAGCYCRSGISPCPEDFYM